jgi:hypothetical protein
MAFFGEETDRVAVDIRGEHAGEVHVDRVADVW